MKISLTLYDALISANVSPDKAKAVVDAWETDVEKLATKSDLQQVETRLAASISEVRSEMKVMRWQLGVIFVCVVVPLLKLGFDLLARPVG
jgi:ABC-type sulfate transport system substrate-binding protein